ncbi:hypothetical protein I312_100796 [Cryptococcus bacillisporus CA1280]|uniref:RING-type E3 ubiquitin transferase n=1 Tax=Cryptococcus bacillisporus CA1280 TaxID=1296109 RepID=A0A0D0VN04_CRYGA|nr:hypothetical protein I312_04475 [Cryptococcus bacillisporus CA1280]
MLRYRLLATIALSTTVYASPAPHRSALTNPEEVLHGNHDFYPYLSEGQKEAEVITVSDWAGYVQEYSIELPRAAILTEQGWLSRWLALGGEGEVVIHLDSPKGAENITLPHRPAAFPSHLSISLPLSGRLLPFSSFLTPSAPHSSSELLACIPSSTLPRPPTRPGKSEDVKIALIERGACDFATKVMAAQDRGAHAVVVGDMKARAGETDAEGRKREGLITMFSPDDTDSLYIPAVFVSRASYLGLRDLLANQTDSKNPGQGLYIDITEGSDEGNALSGLLSFALLMPTLFLLAMISIHRFRVARQREAERAPAMVVLSLPERVWTPDIVWEKDDDSSEAPGSPSPEGEERSLLTDEHVVHDSQRHSVNDPTDADPSQTHPPPPIHPSFISPPLLPSLTENNPSFSPTLLAHPPLPSSTNNAGPSRDSKKHKRPTRRYFSKDECAICMDAFEKGDIVRILPCGHVFHKEECDEWLMKWRKLCPTCRADVTLPQAKVKGSTLTPVIGLPMATDADRTEQTPSSFNPLTTLPNPDLNTDLGGETIGPGLGSTSSPSRPSRLPRIWSDMKERLSGWFGPVLGTGIRLVEGEEEEGDEEEEGEGRERLNVGEEAV